MQIIHEDDKEVGLVLNRMQYEWLLYMATFYGHSNTTHRMKALCIASPGVAEILEEEDKKCWKGWQSISDTDAAEAYQKEIGL